jgi:dolichol-phosphate mannosyltransferase
MPLQLWVQAAHQCLHIKEVGVPRVYLDPNRAFGGVLNDADQRLTYYRKVIQDALEQVRVEQGPCPAQYLRCSR